MKTEKEQKGHSVINASHRVRKIEPKRIEQEGNVLLDVELVVRDKEGNEVSRYQEYGDSFVANFIKMLYCHMMWHHAPDTGSVVTLTDTSNTERTGSATYADEISSNFMDCNAAVANDDYGILVGTGTTATDINDYALDTQVVEGTGSGQMEYGNHSIVASTHDGSSYSYAGITRTVANNSGASIEVKEVGLVTRMDWESTTFRYFLLLREVLGTPVTVNDTQTLTATVRLKCYC